MKIYLQIITPSTKQEVQEIEVKDGDMFIVQSKVELNAKQVAYMSTVINEAFRKEGDKKLLFTKGIDISLMPNDTEENILSGG